MEREKREQDKPKGKAAASTIKKLLPPYLQDPFRQKMALLASLSLVVALLITSTFTISTPPYRMGDIADQNVKAKRDFLIEDVEATAKRREEAVRQAPVVYDLDESIIEHTHSRLEAAFQTIRDYGEESRRFGLQPEALPSQAVETRVVTGGFTPLSLPELPKQNLFQRKKDFETLIGFPVSDEVFATLVESRFSKEFQLKVAQLVKAALEQGIVSNKAWLLEAQDGNIVVRKISSREEQLLSPPHSYPDVEECRNLTRMQALEQGRDVREMIALSYLVSQLLKPNLTFNLEETEHRREQAYASVKPVYVQVIRNEMLVREGQRIGPEELLKLLAHEHGRPQRHWLIVFTTLFLFCGLCILVVAHVTRQHIPSHHMEVQDYLFMALIFILLLTLSRSALWMADMVGESAVHVSGKTFIYAIPLAAGAMMISIFFGVTISLIASLLLTLFTGMLLGKDFGLFFYFLIGAFVAAHGVTPCRNRMTPIRAGLLVGCANVVLILLTALLQDQFVFLKIVTNAFFGLCGGIFAGILVTGFTPLVEMGFGYSTDVKLLELATMDQPLLQELMVQAPGTYHHSIIVGNMVEAAAKSIRANALLAKVAAYYHDIGKIRKPLYFIENQFDCENRHEKLAPSMSSLILISHVKEGVELARQHRLGKPIIDIISQHHGKSFISFFYNKAMEAREKAKNTKGAELPPINIDDYRYPGPKPQTKEAGLVMLADVVEAACRSLTDPTPARIQGMVNRLINNIFSDGQLEECELTLKDLHQIAKHFNQILATVHHKRIEYPAAPAGEGKAKTDAPDSNQRESKSDKDKPCGNREGRRPDLKRLGIH